MDFTLFVPIKSFFFYYILLLSCILFEELRTIFQKTYAEHIVEDVSLFKRFKLSA